MTGQLYALFTDWFGKNIFFHQCGDGDIRISLPLVDELNDNISLYLHEAGDSFRLSDHGELFRKMHGCGITLEGEGVSHEVVSVLRRFGVSRMDSDHSLVAEVQVSEIPEAVMFMAQAISAVESMKAGRSITARKGASISRRMEDFFVEREYHYRKKPEFAGRTGYVHSFDYEVASNDEDASAIVSVLPGNGTDPKFALLYEWGEVRGYSVSEDSCIIAVESGVKSSREAGMRDAKISKLNDEMYRNNIILAGYGEYRAVLSACIG